MDWQGLEYMVAGAGLSGLTVAERLHAAGRKVAVIEKRQEIGGLCASYTDDDTGIVCHRYGTHVIHTSSLEVFEYLCRFGGLSHYRHRVFARHGQRVYPLPINLQTINMFFNVDLDPRSAAGFLKILQSTYSALPGQPDIEPPQALPVPKGIKILPPEPSRSDRKRLRQVAPPANLREAAIGKMGVKLYEAFIEGYSFKHWGCDPVFLPAELAERIPVRTDYNGDYFSDRWQGLPSDGYAMLFMRMAKGIPIHCGVDFADVRRQIPEGCRVIYTGALDEYFNYRYGKLPWRAVRLEFQTHKLADYQGAAVINHPDPETPFIRVHEFRHLRPENTHQSRRKTVTAHEYPDTDLAAGPSYPVKPCGELAATYRAAALAERDVKFCGRLATYRYLDMDRAVAEALVLAADLLKAEHRS